MNDPNNLSTHPSSELIDGEILKSYQEVTKQMNSEMVESLMVEGLERTELNVELGESVTALVERMNTDDSKWDPEDLDRNFGYVAIFGVELTDKIQMNVWVAVSNVYKELEGTAEWLPKSKKMIVGFETFGIPLSEVNDTHGDPDSVEFEVSSLDYGQGQYKATYLDGSSVSNEGMRVIIEALNSVPAPSE